MSYNPPLISTTVNTGTERQFYVVGIGASAGGLEALEAFFRAMPPDSGLAFVVVQHLSPDFKSHMEELLARQTSIPVHRVENGMSVEANAIYLIPSRMEMVISEGRLLLTERNPDRGLTHPIDQFFRSLASDAGRYAIGVVLSGTGSDGSKGVKEIHEAGGLVFAQDEASAKFDGMPMSASATGVVDLVLPPTAIAEALVNYAKNGVSRESLIESETALNSLEGADQLFLMLNKRYGLDFSQYKSTTVGRRITRRMNLLDIGTLREYISHVGNNEEELSNLYMDLLIGVTKFFRDSEAFDVLQSQVIAKLFKGCQSGDKVRIWVAACASGEEAYSIAMLVDEELRRQGLKDQRIDVKIFATDAHDSSLQTGARGIYSAESLQDFTEERKNRYFSRTRDGYQVNRELRNYIVFAPHNIVSDAPFTQMDLVICRNMLIYLQPAAQKKALSLFHFALKSGGSLFLGPSESPGELADEFQVIDKRWKIYAKRRDVRLAVGTRVPLGRRPEKLQIFTGPAQPVKSNRVDPELIHAYDQLLTKKVGSSILVNERGDMLHIFGGAERFLKPQGGRPSNHLVEMVDDSLRSTISVGWQRAIAKGVTVRYASTVFTNGDNPEEVSIQIEPLRDGESGPNNVLVIIQSRGAIPVVSEPQDALLLHDQRCRVESLESELQVSQHNLQATLEEMETANEELQAANEELVASNEELQSTNEELHSVNEELYTVNAEHQRRVEELAQSNDDMDNLLATTRVGVIFLDQDLLIRRFTPEIGRVFFLTNNDIGRSLEPFSHVFHLDKLVDNLKEVLRTQQEIDLQVEDKSGTSYLLRISPYRSGDETEGVVLTLIDITTLAAAEAEIRLQHLAIESAVNGIIITDPRKPGNPITYANQGFMKLTGYDRNEIVGRNCKFLQGADTDPKAIRSIRTALRKCEAIRVTLKNYRKDGSSFWNDLQITPVADRDGKITNFVGIQHDITEEILAQETLERANEAAEQANQAKSSFLATMSHELRTPLTAVLGFADILRAELREPQVLEKVDTIKRNGSYLLALLNDILDLSKIEAGKLIFEQKVVSIYDVMQEVETLMQNRAVEAGIPLRFELPQELHKSVIIDEVRVRQILVNLISNAIKFTEVGEVVVSVAFEQRKGYPLELAISVKDTGIGISAQQQTRLFSPFSQASEVTKKQFGGTGLGLSISKRLAEGMGGTIEFESKLGVGSCFVLKLPINEVPANKLRQLNEKTVVPNTSQKLTNKVIAPEFPKISAKVLLADDRRDVWRVGKYFLELGGANVTVVEDGKQAVQAIQRADQIGEPFDLVLMDMQMPVMTGRDATAQLRTLGYKLPIIALTADAMEGERESCIKMGCDEYFPKPIDGPKLLNLIASMLK